jgi:hypothetical protein
LYVYQRVGGFPTSNAGDELSQFPSSPASILWETPQVYVGL